MTNLPQQGKTWSQASGRDNFDPSKFGSLISTCGIDLSENSGRVRLGKRMILSTTEADVSDLNGVPVGFWSVGSGLYTICGSGTPGNATGKALANDGTIKGAFSASSGGTPPTKVHSGQSDGVLSRWGTFYVSEEDGGHYYLCKKIGNSNWSARIDFGLYGQISTHMLTPFQDRVYMTTDYSKIVSMDSSESTALTGANTIVLNGISQDFQNIITRPFVSQGAIFIPCVNYTGSQAFVYIWDGAATTYQTPIPLDSPGAFSGCDCKGVPYIMNAYGELQAYNGSVFKTVAALYRKNRKLLHHNRNFETSDRFIHPNGMKTVNGKVRMLIDNRNYDSASTVEETIPAGLYEFDPEHPERGIYCIQLLGMTKSGDTIVDFGGIRLAGVGGIQEMQFPDNASGNNGTMLVGAKYYVDATTSKSGIWYDDRNDTLQKAGSLVTLKMDSSGDRSAWPFIRWAYSKLKNSVDKIVAKFRTDEEDPVEATITWTGTTTFTVLNSAIDLTGYLPSAMSSAKGAEVEILQGVGANRCSQILSATLNAGTWTVTVDETHVGATGTAKARFQKWIWLEESVFSQGLTYGSGKSDEKSSKIQLKFWMTWIGPRELERISTDETETLPAKMK